MIPDNFFDVLLSLKSTSSSNMKKTILKKYRDEDLLKKYFVYALEKNLKYGVNKNKIVKYPDNEGNKKEEFENMFILLDALSERKFTGNDAVDKVNTFLKESSPRMREVFLSIIEKKPRCGVNYKLYCEIFEPEHAFEVKLCKAFPFDVKKFYKNFDVEKGIFSQKKADGARCLCVYNPENPSAVTFFSSGGRVFQMLDKLAECVNVETEPYILDGELLVEDPLTGREYSRKEGNGILNKSLQGTITEEEADKIRYFVWDKISLTDYNNNLGSKPYLKVVNELSHYTLDNERIHIIPTKFITNVDDVFDHFREMVGNGYEGTIIKDPNMRWKNKRVNEEMKFKIEVITTLKVIGIQEGEGKYTGKCGSLTCSSKEGKVVVSVSGFTDEEREEIWNNQKEYMGRLIDVKSNGIIEHENTYSLFLPRYVEFRENKPEGADTYEYIVKQSTSVDELLNRG